MGDAIGRNCGLACWWLMGVFLIAPCEAADVASAQLRDLASPEELEFFEKAVRPLLVEHCYECHSTKSEKLQAGLLVDSRASLLEGGDSGAAVVPGDVDGSLFIEAVRYESYEMPPEGKLADAEIQTFERWIEMGAPWPEEAAPTASAARPEFDLEDRRNQHWSWQPIQRVAPPHEHSGWSRDEIDQFVFARLDQEGLQPAPDADRHVLMRRLYFDLIGLPPTPAQAAEFLAQPGPHAVTELVDKLLVSEQFGEHWARHWLDLVRYAESRGHEFDNDAPNAYQYRDYVIRALNADVPYDQFVREQIAGDLLPQPRLNRESGFNESILGTGFWHLGEWVHSPVDIRKDESDRFDNMIDVMSKTFLGVTVACARCHDHKFDAISTADYYSLSGFLQSSDYRQVRFESIEHNARVADELNELDAKYRAIIESSIENSGFIDQTPKLSDDAAAAIVVDYEAVEPIDYLQDGFIFGGHPRHAGEPGLTVTGGEPTIQFSRVSAAVSDRFWDGLESVSGPVTSDKSSLAKIPRSGRTLHTPSFEVRHGNVAARVEGRGHVFACVDSHRMVAGPLHGEVIRPIKEKNAWVELDLSRYIGHRVHLEFTPAVDADLKVSAVTDGATTEVRKELDERAKTLGDAVTDFESEVRKRLGDQWESLTADWAKEREQLSDQVMRRSELAIAMIDGDGEDDHVLIRGNSAKPGDLEPRHFLTAISGSAPIEIPQGSGRLQLAEHITAADNPLTRRVIVNRIWHYLFGRGIVPTTDDFGVLGQLPTHPELLDYLATEFAEDGQSIQRMIRRIVLSRTYQMASNTTPAAVAADPKNLLWHHRPIKRLEGETIRDALLVLSGRLDATMYGPSVPVYLTSFMDGRGRPPHSGPLDGAGRRSIYTAVRRNFLSPFMTTFDAPTPFSTMGRRNVSNVPAQALILMNDPLVVELARDWAARGIQQFPQPRNRINWMFQSAFARPASAQELQLAADYIDAQSAARELDTNSLDVWADLAHALVNAKEFIYIP
ncbi:Planctomycete cytochrome C [Allorhodopirellula heiligendammensis]|uniref:Planctomycete cytochrome C n=2 Tax=Allorhodopirellula heiligendammensis TaxID=2714739 RepID=A0A5C6BFD7_9BACT|nr:Planctomycete cytochrome C [Allorhodopirellula heiligendammensis]